MTSLSAWLMNAIALVPARRVAELAGARRRRLHRVDEAALDVTALERLERALGGPALRRHLRAQRGGLGGRIGGEPHRAGESRVRELARIALVEAQLQRRLDEALDKIEHVRRAAARHAGHGVEHRLARAFDDRA